MTKGTMQPTEAETAFKNKRSCPYSQSCHSQLKKMKFFVGILLEICSGKVISNAACDHSILDHLEPISAYDPANKNFDGTVQSCNSWLIFIAKFYDA